MDRKSTCECKSESHAISKPKSKSTQSIKKCRSQKDAKVTENNQLRKKPLEDGKTKASGGAADKTDVAEDQTATARAEGRLAEVEAQLQALQESYRQKQWRHFRYLLPGAAAAAGLGPESDLAAAAIVSLRDQVDALQHTLQEIQERGEDSDVVSLKTEVRRLREEKNRLTDRVQKALDMANTYRQQLEEADGQLERANKRQTELERDYALAHKALESVICDASDQEYAVNVAQAGRRNADITLQLQLRVAELEKELQAEKAARAQLEAEAAERVRPPPPPPQPSALSVKRDAKKAGNPGTKKGKGGDGEEGPTVEELMERLHTVTAELQEARALLEEAEATRKRQAADYAVLREDVRDLHSRVAAVTQLAKRERTFSDALKEALEDMEVQWRKQFEDDEEQLRQAERRQKEADLKLEAAEGALVCCHREAARLAASLEVCHERAAALRHQLLAALPQPPSKMIEFLGQKLDETERELEEVRNQLREEQQVSATLEAELCDYDDYFIDGTVTSYRMALSFAGTRHALQGYTYRWAQLNKDRWVRTWIVRGKVVVEHERLQKKGGKRRQSYREEGEGVYNPYIVHKHIQNPLDNTNIKSEFPTQNLYIQKVIDSE
ncbi:myosin-7B-like [Schistocerca cancellata]|uniref:myosin-7B-like n=1 Tax=Schistocerca cancellata TaxID=274614 RepID=UPI0021192438|nr:myosin-7B-like [Schistocerca cancellata]